MPLLISNICFSPPVDDSSEKAKWLRLCKLDNGHSFSCYTTTGGHQSLRGHQECAKESKAGSHSGERDSAGCWDSVPRGVFPTLREGVKAPQTLCCLQPRCRGRANDHRRYDCIPRSELKPKAVRACTSNSVCFTANTLQPSLIGWHTLFPAFPITRLACCVLLQTTFILWIL